MHSRLPVLAAAAAALLIDDVPHRSGEPSGYRRPGGHASAKDAKRANRRRSIEKQTKKAQRRGR